MILAQLRNAIYPKVVLHVLRIYAVMQFAAMGVLRKITNANAKTHSHLSQLFKAFLVRNIPPPICAKTKIPTIARRKALALARGCRCRLEFQIWLAFGLRATYMPVLAAVLTLDREAVASKPAFTCSYGGPAFGMEHCQRACAGSEV